MNRTAKRSALTTGALCVFALMSLLAAGCGADEPATLQSVPTTAPTTFDTTKEYAGEDRGTVKPSRDDQATPNATEPSGASGVDAPPPSGSDNGGASAQEQSGAQREPLEPNPPPTADLLGPVPYVIPDQPVLTIGETTYLTLMPGTENGVVGWTWGSSGDDGFYNGTVDMVFDGWEVEHLSSDEGILARITMHFTMAGNYVVAESYPGLLTLFPEIYRGKVPASTAVRWVAANQDGDASVPVPVEVEWRDSAVWAPVHPGENRELWMRWTVPGDTDRFEVVIQDSHYVIYPHDPGVWGGITERDTQVKRFNPPTSSLIPPCYRDCQPFGIDITSAYIYLDGIPTTTGWGISIEISPYSQPEDVSNADIRVRHEGRSEVYYPTRDVWGEMESNQGSGWLSVPMPTRESPLYVGVSLPDGTELVWKTIAPLRSILFSNADWRWDEINDERAEQAAINAADTICWAHWTKKADPRQLFQAPVPVIGDQTVLVTGEMINWAISNVCDHG